ncbi:MAG: type IV toxin-antitoxin system AbiEi family antitoxin domain-containing protein [Clostridia bacterium]|nr:type IV toxin-antitoxin system AbiEi family antitoxin domain-containing protein [Clostridia bacterium]
MGAMQEIIEMAKSGNGTVTAQAVARAGFSHGNLKHLVDKGLLEKVARGVYVLPDAWGDEMFNLQSRFKRGIFSHESALFLWGLTDKTPSSYSMTFPTSYNLSKPKAENVRCKQCKTEWYELGVETVETPNGNLVRAYNRERTLCDLLRPNSASDIQAISGAFKQYAGSASKNIPLLSEYAQKLGVASKVRSYLEVLL